MTYSTSNINGEKSGLKISFDIIDSVVQNQWIVLKIPVSNRDILLEITPTLTVESKFVNNLGATGSSTNILPIVSYKSDGTALKETTLLSTEFLYEYEEGTSLNSWIQTIYI